MIITYTTLKDPHMAMCYRIAKDLYDINKWNKKTVPVCVIVKDDEILSYGIGGNGMHQLTGVCHRVNKPGSSYSGCPWCIAYEHAEAYALRRVTVEPKGATMYMYGMYKACPDCLKALAIAGIESLVLLRNADVLFNRHKVGTVIGKPKQFK